MKKHSLIVLILAFTILTFAAFRTTQAEETKSVAWYTANIREAKAKNQQCHDDPSIKAAQSQECANALHALEISFGVNRH